MDSEVSNGMLYGNFLHALGSHEARETKQLLLSHTSWTERESPSFIIILRNQFLRKTLKQENFLLTQAFSEFLVKARQSSKVDLFDEQRNKNNQDILGSTLPSHISVAEKAVSKGWTVWWAYYYPALDFRHRIGTQWLPVSTKIAKKNDAVKFLI